MMSITPVGKRKERENGGERWSAESSADDDGALGGADRSSVLSWEAHSVERPESDVQVVVDERVDDAREGGVTVDVAVVAAAEPMTEVAVRGGGGGGDGDGQQDVDEGDGPTKRWAAEAAAVAASVTKAVLDAEGECDHCGHDSDCTCICTRSDGPRLNCRLCKHNRRGGVRCQGGNLDKAGNCRWCGHSNGCKCVCKRFTIPRIECFLCMGDDEGQRAPE